MITATFTIRPFQEKDREEVIALLRELDLDYPARSLPDFRVAETGGRIAAMAEMKDFGTGWLLSCVGVPEALQGSGIGASFVRQILAGADKDVYLYTLIPAFFEKLGFREAAGGNGAPPRSIYDCEHCDPRRCRRLVWRPRRPRYPEFKPLTAADRPLLEQYFPPDDRYICDLSLAATMAWRDCEHTTFTFVGDTLCLLLQPHCEAGYFLEPLGGNCRDEAVRTCLAHIGRISRASRQFLAGLEPDRYRVSPLPDQFDYVYESTRLARMNGRRLDGKRNLIKKFRQNCPGHRFEPLRPEHRDEALAMFDRWAAARKQSLDAKTQFTSSAYGRPECQKAALERAFEDFLELRLSGGVMRVDGRLEGFILGSPLNGEMIAAHFEYANLALTGIYQALLSETCAGVYHSYPLVNLEPDLGLPGLRKVKRSYQPLRLEEKFEITLP